MKPLPLILLALMGWNQSRADIKYIDIHKVDPAGRYASQFKTLIDNLSYFDHWSQQWSYPVSRDSLIRQLKTGLILFSSLNSDPLESDLLLGEIAHYLYNLDQQDYYDTAEAYYLKAIRIDRKDCRGHWFLANHYILSNEIVKGVQSFQTARELASDQTPADFWQEYAYGMMFAGKPSHCLYALDQFRRKGGSSPLARVMDSTIRSKCIQADPDSTYANKDLWEASRNGQLVSFTSRALGTKMDIDAGWSMRFNGFTKRMTAIFLTPGILTNQKGEKIGYNILLIAKVASEGETLQSFMAPLMKPSVNRDPVFVLSDIYSNGLSYTLQDKSAYADKGGAHIHYIGIERDLPAYPGLALENQVEDLKGKAGGVQYYLLQPVRNRFPGKIFYFFVLDTCEDIHAASWDVFRNLVTHQMIIE